MSAPAHPMSHGAASRLSGVVLADVGKLPPTLKPEQAFALLGVGRTAGYELIRCGELPSLRLGGKLLVPTAPLLLLVGVTQPVQQAGVHEA